MYTPRTSVEAIPNASIHHSALQNRDFGHTYDRSRALVRALEKSVTRPQYAACHGVPIDVLKKTIKKKKYFFSQLVLITISRSGPTA
jgi:hypothetical protein